MVTFLLGIFLLVVNSDETFRKEAKENVNTHSQHQLNIWFSLVPATERGQLGLEWPMWSYKGSRSRSSSEGQGGGSCEVSHSDPMTYTVGVQQIANTSWDGETAQSSCGRMLGLYQECAVCPWLSSSKAGIGSALLSASLKPELRELR